MIGKIKIDINRHFDNMRRKQNEVDDMSTLGSYKMKLIKEIESLSELEAEKILKTLTLIRREFIDEDESRYHTKGWIEAEKEASQYYKDNRGKLKPYPSVDQLMDEIEKGIG